MPLAGSPVQFCSREGFGPSDEETDVSKETEAKKLVEATIPK